MCDVVYVIDRVAQPCLSWSRASRSPRRWTGSSKGTPQPPDNAGLPCGWAMMISRSTGTPYYFHADTGTSTFAEPVDPGDPPLPSGWVMHISKSTGKEYFWDAVTQTSHFKRPALPAN